MMFCRRCGEMCRTAEEFVSKTGLCVHCDSHCSQCDTPLASESESSVCPECAAIFAARKRERAEVWEEHFEEDRQTIFARGSVQRDQSREDVRLHRVGEEEMARWRDYFIANGKHPYGGDLKFCPTCHLMLPSHGACECGTTRADLEPHLDDEYTKANETLTGAR